MCLSVKGCDKSLQVGGLVDIIFILIPAISFFFFRCVRRRVKRGRDKKCGLSQRNACLVALVQSFLLYSNSHIFVSKTFNSLNLLVAIFTYLP